MQGMKNNSSLPAPNATLGIAARAGDAEVFIVETGIGCQTLIRQTLHPSVGLFELTRGNTLSAVKFMDVDEQKAFPR